MRRVLPLLAVLLVSAAACSINRPGHVSAPTEGSLDAPLAKRAPMDAERVAQCGDGELTQAGVTELRRSPYLQDLTDTATSLLFTIGDGAVAPDALNLHVTTPGGGDAGKVELAQEDVPVRLGSLQMRGRVEGLSPFTMYCYQLFDGDQPLMQPAGFRTAPKPGDTKTKFGFAVIGDSGAASDDQRKVLEQMFTVDHDLVLHVGDIAYNDGTLEQFDAHHFAVYSKLFKLVPHFPTPGNHEYRTDSAAPYLAVFDVPKNGDPTDPERYYSFDYGPIHFVSIDTNDLGDAEEQWIANDLATTEQPFIIAYGHHPPYSSGEHGSDANVRARVIPHLVQNNAQLMLSGHDHDYERTKVMDGVTYIVTGGGGVGTRPTGSSDFTEVSGEVLEFLYGEYDGQNLVLHAIDATGKEFDNLVIAPR